MADYPTVTQNITAKTETTLTVQWSSNAVIDYIWYSIDNGVNWQGINVADGTNGSYTITDLTANRTYLVKTRVRRADNQLTTDSSAITATTYSYPFANNTPSFTVGDIVTIGLFNPLGRSVTVSMIGANGTLIGSYQVSGSTVAGFNGAEAVELLLISIPSSQSGTYSVSVAYGDHVNVNAGGTYTVGSSAAPSIGAVSYMDTNSTVTAITGDNQLIVQSHSTVKFTAEGLTAGTGAALTACSVNVNGNSYPATIDGTTATLENLTIYSGSDVTAQITVTDSRGSTATKPLNVTVLPWFLPSAIIQLQRQSNYYTATDINVNANFAQINGQNSVTIQCRYKKISDSTWSAYITLQDEITSVLQLDNLYEWNVQVVVSDLFGSTTYNAVVPLGMPIVYYDVKKHSTGFNCFPIDDNSVEVNGKNISRCIMTAWLNAPMTYFPINSYTAITLTNSVSTGTRLTFRNGGIQIGAGVDYVLVSGRIGYDTVPTSGTRQLRIAKNSASDGNTGGWVSAYMAQGEPGTLEITPVLVPVIEGDIIYLFYHTIDDLDVLGGNAAGKRTSLTVEVV